jgi:hypothetical protein
MHWAAIVFGWPTVLASIASSAVGLVLRRPLLVWLGAVAALPFMFYLLLTPRFWMVAALAVPTHFGSALAVARRWPRLAWLLFIPTPAAATYVAAAIAGG